MSRNSDGVYDNKTVVLELCGNSNAQGNCNALHFQGLRKGLPALQCRRIQRNWPSREPGTVLCSASPERLLSYLLD